MNNTKTIELYRDTEIAFRSDAWVNATQMAKPFKKLPADFLRLQATKSFSAALTADKTVMGNPITVQQGGVTQGTWMHPDLALEFARWLSPEFAIWCNRTIRRIMQGESAAHVEMVRAFTGLVKAVEVIAKAQATGDVFAQRLTLGLHNLQGRIEMLEANAQPATSPTPRLRLLPKPRPDALEHLIEIDRILFTAESADWWMGTAAELRTRLEQGGLHLSQLRLRTLAKTKPRRCLDLRNVARGTARIYVLLRPGTTPDSLTLSLIRQQVRNLRAA